MKLQSKIILSSTLLLFILLVVANSSVYFIFKKTMTDNAIERLQVESSDITEGLKQTNNTSINQANLLRAYLPPNGMIRILPTEGKPLLVAIKDQMDLQNHPYSFQSSEQTTVIRIDRHLYAVAHIPIIWTKGEIVSVEITEPLTDVEQSLQTLQVILIAASLVILIPTIIGSRILSQF